MTVRRGRRERALIAAFALIAPLFAAGCSTPETYFDWEYASAPKPKARVAPVKHRVVAQKPRCVCDPAPIPTARPAPTWYQQSIKPVNHVEQEPLAPVGTKNVFTWPVSGRVVSEFGAGYGGQRNDGINIAVREGQPIRAAGDGTVSYAGNELKNYGNLVLIKHDNGYATVYAHAESFVVSKGQRVARGQVIGYGGATGDVSSPQLHFEVRRNAREPVNPRPLLGPLQVASR